MLEPEGTVEIKFKTKDLIKSMRRLDVELRQMLNELNQPETAGERRAELERNLSAREQHLLPVYHQVMDGKLRAKVMLWKLEMKESTACSTFLLGKPTEVASVFLKL